MREEKKQGRHLNEEEKVEIGLRQETEELFYFLFSFFPVGWLGSIRGKVIACQIMLGADNGNGNKNSYILLRERTDMYCGGRGQL